MSLARVPTNQGHTLFAVAASQSYLPDRWFVETRTMEIDPNLGNGPEPGGLGDFLDSLSYQWESLA